MLECNPVIFTALEIKELEENGHWFVALTNGVLTPFNEAQKQFVEVAQFRRKPENYFEKLWFKYLKRKEIEAKAGNSLYKNPELEENTFYNREMVKKLKKEMFKITSESHKGE